MHSCIMVYAPLRALFRSWYLIIDRPSVFIRGFQRSPCSRSFNLHCKRLRYSEVWLLKVSLNKMIPIIIVLGFSTGEIWFHNNLYNYNDPSCDRADDLTHSSLHSLNRYMIQILTVSDSLRFKSVTNRNPLLHYLIFSETVPKIQPASPRDWRRLSNIPLWLLYIRL